MMIRMLSKGELLRLYQLPLCMDDTLGPIFGSEDALPFSRAASLASFLRIYCASSGVLWGGVGMEMKGVETRKSGLYHWMRGLIVYEE